MSKDSAPKESPLCQVVERDRWTVNVEIYDDGQGGWILEIVDDRGNSTVWTDSFSTDRAAYDEATRAIDCEGITSFIGPDSDMRFLLDS